MSSQKPHNGSDDTSSGRDNGISLEGEVNVLLTELLTELEEEAPSKRMRKRFSQHLVALEPDGEPLTGTRWGNLLLVAAAVLIALVSSLWLARLSSNDGTSSVPPSLLADLRSDQALLRLASVQELEGLAGNGGTDLDELLIEALESEPHPAVELALIEALARRGSLASEGARLPEPASLSETAQWVYLSLPEVSLPQIDEQTRRELLKGIREKTVLDILARQ